MTVNEKDLMLGDWITVVAKDGERTNVEVNYLSNPEDEYCGEANDDYVDHFDAIPLTPEILLKNGFRELEDESNGAKWYELISEKENIRFSLMYTRSVFCWLGPLDFQYVHELQHALKMSGIEKKIVLP